MNEVMQFLQDARKRWEQSVISSADLETLSSEEREIASTFEQNGIEVEFIALADILVNCKEKAQFESTYQALCDDRDTTFTNTNGGNPNASPALNKIVKLIARRIVDRKLTDMLGWYSFRWNGRSPESEQHSSAQSESTTQEKRVLSPAVDNFLRNSGAPQRAENFVADVVAQQVVAQAAQIGVPLTYEQAHRVSSVLGPLSTSPTPLTAQERRVAEEIKYRQLKRILEKWNELPDETTLRTQARAMVSNAERGMTAYQRVGSASVVSVHYCSRQSLQLPPTSQADLPCHVAGLLVSNSITRKQVAPFTLRWGRALASFDRLAAERRQIDRSKSQCVARRNKKDPLTMPMIGPANESLNSARNWAYQL